MDCPASCLDDLSLFRDPSHSPRQAVTSGRRNAETGADQHRHRQPGTPRRDAERVRVGSAPVRRLRARCPRGLPAPLLLLVGGEGRPVQTVGARVHACGVRSGRESRLVEAARAVRGVERGAGGRDRGWGGLLPATDPCVQRRDGVGVLGRAQPAVLVLVLVGEGLHEVLVALGAAQAGPVRGRVLDERRRVIDRVEGEDGDRDPPGDVAVVGEVPHGCGVRGEALDARAEGGVVMGSGVDDPLVGEGVPPADPVVHDVAERERGEPEVRFKGPFRDFGDGEDVVEVALLQGGALLGQRREAGALLEPGAQAGRRHRRPRAQSLPQRILRFWRPGTVPAVVLMDHAQVHPIVVAAGAAAEDAVGEQRAVIGAVLLGAVDLDGLRGDWPWMYVRFGLWNFSTKRRRRLSVSAAAILVP